MQWNLRVVKPCIIVHGKLDRSLCSVLVGAVQGETRIRGRKGGGGAEAEQF
jgi:hypothetical protein